MSNRLRQKKLYISRYPANIARYRMLKHNKDKANPDRFKYLYSGAKRIDKDGYNSLKLQVLSIQEFHNVMPHYKPLYSYKLVFSVYDLSSLGCEWLLSAVFPKIIMGLTSHMTVLI